MKQLLSLWRFVKSLNANYVSIAHFGVETFVLQTRFMIMNYVIVRKDPFAATFQGCRCILCIPSREAYWRLHSSSLFLSQMRVSSQCGHFTMAQLNGDDFADDCLTKPGK